MAPSVVQIDSGELAAVQSTLGIAHPTGYPLFTILGYLFLRIPWFDSQIKQLNFLSLIYCILGLFFWMKSLHLILSHCSHETKSTRDKRHPKHQKRAASQILEKPVPNFISMIPFITGGFFLAFSRTFWSQSTSIEVYSLHVLLIVLVIYSVSRAFIDPSPGLKSWIFAAVALSLSFSNHMTTLLILPGVIFLFLKKLGFRRKTLISVFIMTGVCFVTIGLFYLYLPIRAVQNPELNWGNPENWKNFIRHVSGRQYSVWLFSSADIAWKNIRQFLHAFPGEFTWAGLILGLMGAIQALKKSTGLFVFLFICFFCTVLYAINYDIHDLETYFLLAYIIFAFWIALGVRWCLVRIRRTKLVYLVLPVLFFSVVYESVSHFSKSDRSDLYLYEDYTKQALASLPNDAVLLSYQWDYFISPAYYFQFVEEYRKDVAVIDKELLRRSWYYHQMKMNYPEVMEPVSQEVQHFLSALEPFEEGGNFNPTLLEQRYRGLIARIIEVSMEERDVYIGPELVQNEFRRKELYLPAGYTFVPDLFFFRVVKTDDYSPLILSDTELRFPKRGNPYTDTIRNFVSNMIVWRSFYEIQHGKIQEAKYLRSIYIRYFPSSRLPQQIRDL
jgi:hypothetical protein